MARSELRVRLRREQAARWRRLTPAERIALAQEMVSAGLELRRSALRALARLPKA